MTRRIFTLLTILFITVSIRSQEVISTISEQQKKYILNDTLPVSLTLLPNNINTHFSEYNGILFEDSTFYFTSLRSESDADYDGFFDAYWSTYIYQSHLNQFGYTKPEPISPVINQPKYYNCNFTFNDSRTLLYFTRCILQENNYLQCNIWKSHKIHDHWEKPKPLNRRINLPGTNTTQPFVVEYEDYHILYFASDRPKGFGNMDIWYTVYQNDHYNDPINLGSNINTKGNEITPFYDKSQERLFFSSDSHLNIGGYDIFYSMGAFNQWSAPTNMGVPFNSPYNDFYFSQNRHNNNGYLSSNRPTPNSSEADTCCSDLYYFEWNGEWKAPVCLAKDTISTQEFINNILPLTLYFHNDEPDPRSWESSTKANYRNTLADYISKREIYEEEYAKGLKGESREEAVQHIRNFFKDSVEQGFAKLELFTDYLQKELESGHNVSITIKGFASPLHKADYNMNLSSRRISSLKNYLKEYKNGLFLPYLNGQKPNRLNIHEEPKGQSTASKFVSNNVNDKRNSVYSIAASLERRIQIVEFESVK